MKISQLLVIAAMPALPTLAFAQPGPATPSDAPKTKTQAGAAVKDDAARATQGGPGSGLGTAATPGAGAETGAAKKRSSPG